VQIAQLLCGSRTLAAIATAVLLAGCGMSGSKSGAAAQSQGSNQGSGQDTKAQHRSGDTPDPDLVTAVNSAHSNTPIGMKFGLASRPAVGTPLKVTIALIPAVGAGISHIHASFQPGDGLLLQSDRTLDVSDPGAGVVIEHEVSVVPQQSGVLSLGATVMVDMDGNSLARSYAIPLIVRDHP
jgi:hypothetical protein